MTDDSQTVVWQVDYRPFGETTISVASVENNLRFPGQYFDAESGLHYNYFRDYDPTTGRYIQSDPIGLRGGINTYTYVGSNPIRFTDPRGLYVQGWHNLFTLQGATQADLTPQQAQELAEAVVNVDSSSHYPGTQSPESAYMHAMCAPGKSRSQCQREFLEHIDRSLSSCTQSGLAQAIHAYQDFYASGHGLAEYNGFTHLPPSHVYGDLYPSAEEVRGVPIVTENLIRRFQNQCSCR